MQCETLEQRPERLAVLVVVESGQYLVFGGAQPLAEFAKESPAADQNKGAGAAGRQAPVVAGNIRALITGGQLARYEPPAASIIVPIGPDGGAGQRAGSEDLVPAETVAQLKGRDMMVQRFAELLGLST